MEPAGVRKEVPAEGVISTEALRRELEEQEEQQEACVAGAGAGAGGVRSRREGREVVKAYGLSLRARGEAVEGGE